MRKFAGVFLAIGFGLSAVSAQAMPLPTVSADDAFLAKAAYGCGAGMTIGPYGHCRPKFNCPPGWHPGPQGFHCFRN